MPFDVILMSYKENCKVEGEIITGLKIARLYYACKKKQVEIANDISCHKNTVYKVIRACKDHASKEAFKYLKGHQKIPFEKLSLFNFLESSSRKPLSHSRSLKGKEEDLVLKKHRELNYGPKRLRSYLLRQGYDTEKTYTLGKIKGVYKRNDLKRKKIRTANGERRSLYNYAQIGAFEHLQYDTKKITDKHSLPLEIYLKFKESRDLPVYQWTIACAKTKTRFLAWSHSLMSFFGFKFLELVLTWLRAHGIQTKINVQFDLGGEFCSGSKRKTETWNEDLAYLNATVKDTKGIKWKQNLVEQTHRMDDEEFYCPRGEFIKTKTDFLIESQYWIVYQNQRPNGGMILKGLSPQEKLEELGFYNAKQICSFPSLILEDFFKPFQTIFPSQNGGKSYPFGDKKSQNVLTPYLCLKIFVFLAYIRYSCI